ncbi:MAG: hypothetical protein WCS90_02560 [Bacilli bacterium]
METARGMRASFRLSKWSEMGGADYRAFEMAMRGKIINLPLVLWDFGYFNHVAY